jgi:hypothetical protein
MRKDATIELIRRVLKDDYLQLVVQDYEMRENVAEGGPCHVTVRLKANGGEHTDTIQGHGVGSIEALYHGLMEHYAREFESLQTLQFTGFSVKGRMDTARDRKGLDAVAQVSLTVQNSDGRTFEFEEAGRSLVAAGLAVVVDACEYFVNSERAFISVYRALVDARERGRADLVQTYTNQLAELVNTTSYTRVIERIRATEHLK